jgi:hypothetical protein
MEGYEVITSDEEKAGRVVGVQAGNLIVEQGLLRKTRHAIPTTFAHTDESEEVVRVSVPKEIVESSPKVENGSIDERAVAEHYGLAEGFAAPETEGYGDLVPDDPARSAEEEELRTGIEPAAQRRAETREGAAPTDETSGRQIIPSDPHR